MKLAPHLLRDLHATLTHIVVRSHTSSELNHLIKVCHTLTLIFLQHKVSETNRDLRFQGLNNSDIAFDCIADLFQQESDGGLVRLEGYFQGIDIPNISDEELLSHLRRLVFSKVNQSIFRIYNESDPSLGKIIRNIKLAIQSIHNFDIVNRFDETCITPAGCDSLEHLPQAERNDIENHLRSDTRGGGTIPQLLAHLSLSLRRQSSFSRIVPVVTVALAIRSLFQNQIETTTSTVDDNDLNSTDSIALIRRACVKARAETKPQYVGKGKIAEDIFEKYFNVIEEHIVNRLVHNDGEAFSFYKGLRSYLPELNEEEYRRTHKSKLEYLARLSHKRAVDLLKKEL